MLSGYALNIANTLGFQKLFHNYMTTWFWEIPSRPAIPNHSFFLIFASMQKCPIGLQDFRELRTGGYVYIDKTREVFGLVETGKYYFLSRPRRFGKSLLISTLKYLFQGERKAYDVL